jgi:hypothetical protein
MMHVRKFVQSANLPRLATVFVAVAGLGLASCDDNGGDPRSEIGAHPMLPALQQYLLPPIRIATAVGWGKGESRRRRRICRSRHWPPA